mmetsp:Transcript_1404/g.4151  ORF Transcript_1404/g.4151 Transcript_1404/m.4151 type:complete len:276 (-) Transcript_1404:370-1197(-)
MQVGGEGTDLAHHALVAVDQPVVAQHGRHGDAQTDGGHDQRFTDGAGDLVDRGLAGHTNGGQGLQNAPHGAEQADEGSGRTDGGQEAQAASNLVVHVSHGAVDVDRNPAAQVDVLGQGAFMVLRSLDAGRSDVAEGALFLQAANAISQAGLLEEGGAHVLGLGTQLAGVPQAHDQDVPAAHGHDQQQSQHGLGDHVAVRQHGLQAVRIVDRLRGRSSGSRCSRLGGSRSSVGRLLVLRVNGRNGQGRGDGDGGDEAGEARDHGVNSYGKFWFGVG